MSDEIFNLTKKQIAVMKIIQAGNRDGTYVDIDQLLNRMKNKPHRNTLKQSVRYIEAKGLLERFQGVYRRNATRTVYRLTENGYRHLRAFCWPTLEGRRNALGEDIGEKEISCGGFSRPSTAKLPK